jgi:chromosomal replication initiator protein
VVAASTVQRKDMLVRQYLPLLQEAMATIMPEVKETIVEVDGYLHDSDERVVDVFKLSKDQTKKKEAPEITVAPGVTSKTLNAHYTLENFVVGADNQLAHAAASAAARKPGEAYNPLFIYGNVGLGKTHLMQAIGNEILKKTPKKTIVYTTSEGFTNEFVDAIRGRKTEKLREKYRKIDILIMDDVQFLAGKEQTQMELFHTFNTLYEAHKQIVLSSDRPPKELNLLEPRLRSRFEWGMIVDIGFPDVETRTAILQQKCQERGVFISPEVLSFIASNVRDSVRELEGILNQAIANYELRNMTPTVQNMTPMLRKLYPHSQLVGVSDETQGRPENMDTLIESVARYYHLTQDDLRGDGRRSDIALARQVVMFIAKKNFRLTYQHIGEALGNRIHTTVMHAVEKIEREMKKDEQLQRDVNALSADLAR